jgi:RNA polymerase sigma-70 factor (ECF subfamily)
VDFEALANEHKDAIYRQMLRVCGNHQDAEDVLIEAMMKAYCSMEQLRDSASFRAWLAQIARRVCWQFKEHERLLPLLRLSELEEDGLDLRDTAAQPEEIAATEQMRRLLRDSVAQLAPEFRTVYLLRDIEELPGEEVARRLGISVRAMKSRLHRARAILRERMEVALTRSEPARKKGKGPGNGSPRRTLRVSSI